MIKGYTKGKVMPIITQQEMYEIFILKADPSFEKQMNHPQRMERVGLESLTLDNTFYYHACKNSIFFKHRSLSPSRYVWFLVFKASKVSHISISRISHNFLLTLYCNARFSSLVFKVLECAFLWHFTQRGVCRWYFIAFL